MNVRRHPPDHTLATVARESSSLYSVRQRRSSAIGIGWIVTILSAAYFLLNLQYNTPISVVSIGALGVLGVAGLVLAYTGRIDAAGVTICAAVTLVVTISIYDGDGLFDPGVAAYPLVLVFSALILNRHAVIWLTAAIVAAVVLIAQLQTHGLVNPTIRPNDGDNWIPLSIMFVGSGIAVWIMRRNSEELLSFVRDSDRERIVTVGRLARGTAHHVNTPLGNARTLVTHIRTRMRDTPGADRDQIIEELDLVELEIVRAADLVGRLGATTDLVATSQPRDINVCEWLTVNESRYRTEEDPPLRIVPAGRQVVLRVDPEALLSVTGELVRNAFAHQEGNPGSVTLTVGETAHQVLISVHNGGSPVPSELGDQIFDAFVTTKRSPQHNGLGLFTARFLTVHSLNGTLNYGSDASGTTFTLTIPHAPR